MMQFSLSHPEIDFRLLRDGKEVLNTTGIMSHPDLLEYFYGNNVNEALIKVNEELSCGKVSGYITLPTYHRTNRKAMHFFINQRRVYAKELSKSVEEAYQNLLPKGLFPLCVLNLSLDPSSIDVNVHPSKLEVRLRNPLVVKRIMYHSSGRINQTAKNTSVYYRTGGVLEVSETKAKTKSEIKAETKDSRGSIGKGVQEIFHNFYAWEQPEPLPAQPNDALISVTNNTTVIETGTEAITAASPETAIRTDAKVEVKENQTQTLNLQSCQVIGQFRKTFIFSGRGRRFIYN